MRRDGNAVHRMAIAASVVGSLLVAGCAQQFKQEAKSIQNQPVDCRTAPGDLRMLQSEKANVVQQIAMGATAIYPAGAVLGIVTGTEGTKLSVATGDYNRMIDNKIAQIKSTCGL